MSVVALVFLAMLKWSVLFFTAPAAGGGGWGFDEEEASTTEALGLGGGIVLFRLGSAISRARASPLIAINSGSRRCVGMGSAVTSVRRAFAFGARNVLNDGPVHVLACARRSLRGCRGCRPSYHMGGGYSLSWGSWRRNASPHLAVPWLVAFVHAVRRTF